MQGFQLPRAVHLQVFSQTTASHVSALRTRTGRGAAAVAATSSDGNMMIGTIRGRDGPLLASKTPCVHTGTTTIN